MKHTASLPFRMANLVIIFALSLTSPIPAADLLTIKSDSIEVGIDREKGGAITWLSSTGYPKNIVNIADPGRLIQQSYYAGKILDRTSDGQSKAWSPWPWNPIQGGGVGSAGGAGTWARVPVFEQRENALYSETIPKLWDMADEDAEAVMRQWTALEPDQDGVVRVQCEFQAMRQEGDRWGDTRLSSQEVPACYFTRNFSDVRSYLGEGSWRTERQPPGPPWGKAQPPRKAMAMFTSDGQGVAVFSPSSTEQWNFGPHGKVGSDESTAGPCMHVAPIDRVRMGHQSTYRYRYWLVVGNEKEIALRLDVLWNQYSSESTQLLPPLP